MERFVIDETTNTLVRCNHHMTPERLDYLVIPHQYNGKQIDHIGPHCFDGLVIPFLCIEDGVKYLEDRACENAHILNVKLPRELKIGERCFADSELMEILLPRNLHTIKKETFKNSKFLESISAEVDVSTISYSAFERCRSLKTLKLGYLIKKLGTFFSKAVFLESLEVVGNFDKLEKFTFFRCRRLRILVPMNSCGFPIFPA